MVRRQDVAALYGMSGEESAQKQPPEQATREGADDKKARAPFAQAAHSRCQRPIQEAMEIDNAGRRGSHSGGMDAGIRWGSR